MAITRRQFLKRSSLAGAGAVGTGLFGNPFVRTALSETIGDRYVIVFLLDGGNDGLNTVTAVDNGGGTLRTDYEGWRNTGSGGLRMTPGELAGTVIDPDPNTGASLALHPGFKGYTASPNNGGIYDLYTQGKVAVFQGCGYPDYNLSHDVSSTIWQTADPLGAFGNTGWMGRYLADPSTGYGQTEIPGLNISSSVAEEFIQTQTSVLAARRLTQLGFPFDPDFPGDDGAKETAFLDLHAEALLSGQSIVELVGGTGSSAFAASEAYPALDEDYEDDRPVFDALYNNIVRDDNGRFNRGTARDVREIAKVIYGIEKGTLPAPGPGESDIRPRHFWARNGGYDSHSDQGGAEISSRHFNLHAEVASAIKVLWDDLSDMGTVLHGDADAITDKVVILVWSEFSRRIQQNDNGTDHGSQGPMFLIGGKINGGVYGNHPNIDPLAVDNRPNTVYSQNPADPFRSTDFRDVYGALLKHWLNMPEGIILPNVLKLDTGFPANTYWTTQNFDFLHPINASPLFTP